MTLAKKPANRSGFKVIRADETEKEPMTATHHTERKRRPKSNKKRDDSLYMIRMPEGISIDEAETYRDAFGMTEDYEVVQADTGWIFLVRKGLPNYNEIVGQTVDMGNGFLATVDSEAFAGSATRKDGQHGVKLVELQLDGYDLPAAKTWLEGNDVDFKEGGVEVVDGGVIVYRHDYEKADGRKVRIGEGVVGIVVRAADNDVPVHLYRAVIEESYGYHGYGLLDFAQFLASPYYTDATWDGIYALREVLENVTLYSGLPLDERKALVDNAIEQFRNYYQALIDAMPREAVAAAQRFDRKQTQQEATMPKPNEDKQVPAAEAAEDKTAARTDDQAAKADDAATTDTETRTDDKAGETAAPEFVTKDDLTAAVTSAVTAALEARAEQPSTTGGDTDAVAPEADAAEQRSDETPSESDKVLAEGVKTIADAATKLAERMDGFEKKLENYGESVDARSDTDGDDSAATQGAGEGVDPFQGMMGSIAGLRK